MPEQRVIRESLKITADSLMSDDDERINSRLIEGIDRLPTMYLARSTAGRLMVMTPCKPTLVAERDFLRTIVHKLSFKPDPSAAPTTMLVAECKEIQYEEGFLDLISAVVSSIAIEDVGADFASQVFETIIRWAELFERFTNQDVTFQQAAGLWAELAAVERVVRQTGDVSLNFWLGPRGLPHDIVCGDHALEVKAVTTATISRITINGLLQLSPYPSTDLFITVMQIRDEAGTRSLYNIYEDLSVLGVDRLMLMELIQNEGVSISSRWWDHKLSLLGEELFHVDENFPKIVPDLIHADFELNLIESLKYTVQIGGLPRLAIVDPVGKWLEIHGL